MHYLATEFGTANLYGTTIKQRVNTLANFRKQMVRDCFDNRMYLIRNIASNLIN